MPHERERKGKATIVLPIVAPSSPVEAVAEVIGMNVTLDIVIH